MAKKAKQKNPNDNVISIPNLVSSVALLSYAQQVEELKGRHKEMQEQAARCILKALDQKDHYTFGHSMRVTYFALAVGKELNLTPEKEYELELSALFHDIGKIGIPDRVLNKPARLDDEEFLIMKQHPVKSAEILSGFAGFENVAKAAKHHHERFDGRGYPDGLKGDEIPTFSRIILIADTFDAMTSTRPYRKGLPYQVAFEELTQFSGSQFDPELVKLFIKAMEREDSKQESSFYIPIMGENFDKEAA